MNTSFQNYLFIALFLIPATDILAQSSQNLPYEHKPSNLIKNETRKNQMLIRECIDHCKIPNPTSYSFDDRHRCTEPAHRLFRSPQDCENHTKVEISTRQTNRFGEQYYEVSSCYWKGNEYNRTAECGSTTGRAIEDSKPAEPTLLPFKFQPYEPSQIR